MNIFTNFHFFGGVISKWGIHIEPNAEEKEII